MTPLPDAVSIPKPKPASVPSPVPAQGDAQVPQAPPAGKALPMPQEPAPSATEAPQMSDDLFAQAEAQAQLPPTALQGATQPQSSDDMNSLFAQAEAQSAGGTRPGQETEIDENAPGATMGQRVVAESIGRSPEEQRRLLQNSLGAGFETKLGGKSGNDVLFRKSGDPRFQRMDPGFFHSLSDFKKDLVAFGARTGIDVAGALAGEALGISGGAAVAGPPGAAVGAVVGAGAGGIASAGIRQGAMNALGVPSDVSFKRDAALNALINSATVGAGALLKTPIKAAIGKITDALGDTAYARVLQLAKIREGVEDLQTQIGKPAIAPRGPNAALGTQVQDAVESLGEQLSDQIGSVKQKAQAIAGSNTFPVKGFQQKLTEIIQGEGAVINANGRAEIPNGLELTKPFGAPEGLGALKELVKDYNTLASNNGAMNLKTLFNTLDFYKAPAGFSERLPSTVNGAYQVLRGALREERDTVLPHILTGTPEGDFAQSAYQTYASKIDAINQLRDKALSKGSPEKFAEALITPKNSLGIQQLKSVFGEDSPQFNSIKGAWFSGILNKAVDPESGIVSGAILKREMNRYGDDVLSEIMSPGQKNALTALASQSEKISYSGLLKNPESNDFLRRVSGALASGFQGKAPEGYLHTLWSLFSSNKAALDYLSNDGLLQLAKETSDPQARTMYVKAGQWMQKLIASSDVVVTQKGSKAYHLSIEWPAAAALINANERQNGEKNPDFIRRRANATADLLGGR